MVGSVVGHGVVVRRVSEEPTLGNARLADAAGYRAWLVPRVPARTGVMEEV
jgi:hypothetical protein